MAQITEVRMTVTLSQVTWATQTTSQFLVIEKASGVDIYQVTVPNNPLGISLTQVNFVFCWNIFSEGFYPELLDYRIRIMLFNSQTGLKSPFQYGNLEYQLATVAEPKIASLFSTGIVPESDYFSLQSGANLNNTFAFQVDYTIETEIPVPVTPPVPPIDIDQSGDAYELRERLEEQVEDFKEDAARILRIPKSQVRINNLQDLAPTRENIEELENFVQNEENMTELIRNQEFPIKQRFGYGLGFAKAAPLNIDQHPLHFVEEEVDLKDAQIHEPLKNIKLS